MKNSIKLIIVDDHEIFRSGLKMALGKLKYVQIIGEASDGREFLDLLEKQKPDLVFMDVEMPVMNGVEATRKAIEKYPGLNVIALTMFNDDEYIQSMLDVGVKGFLIKNINKNTLDKAIQTVMNGGNFYSEELFDFFTRQISKEEKSKSDEQVKLTRREKEILQLICEGLSNKEIADILFVSERTVVGHKTNLLAKTDCKNALALMAYAIKNKLVAM
jgi:DNA-binding NarL/FixJ family response regulator